MKGPEIEIWKQLMVILSIADPNYLAQLAELCVNEPDVVGKFLCGTVSFVRSGVIEYELFYYSNLLLLKVPALASRTEQHYLAQFYMAQLGQQLQDNSSQKWMAVSSIYE